MYDEGDIGEYKAIAAVNRLRKINSEIKIDNLVDKVDERNINDLIHGFDVVIDATDNFSTRMTIDKACYEQNIPWVFTGILGAQGQTMAMIPGRTKRLKDMFHGDTDARKDDFSDIEPNPQSSVIAPAVSIMSSMAVMLCFKILLNNYEDIVNRLFVFDTWNNRFKVLNI